MNRRNCAGTALVLAVLMMTGCGSVSFNPEQSGIYLDKDGTMKSADIESFDNSGFEEDRYQKDELQSYVEETISEYNQENCGVAGSYKKDADGLKITINKLEVESGTATLLLNYASIEDYLAFNDGGEAVATLELETAPDAVSAGISLDSLTDAEGNTVDTTNMKTNAKYYVAIINGDTEVTVNGKIAGVSAGAEITGKSTADISGDDDVIILFK